LANGSGNNTPTRDPAGKIVVASAPALAGMVCIAYTVPVSTKLDNAFPTADGGELEPADVAAFLARHPEFLNDRPELLEALTPPAERSGRRVLDMQRYMIARLQTSLRKARTREADLLAAARANRTSAMRAHAAVLALSESGALDNLMEIISNDLPTLLEVDVVVIAVEAEPEHTRSLRSTAGVCLVPAGTVQNLVSASRDVLLTATLGDELQLFGGAAALVKSAAFARLRLGPPGRPALLALGSRDASRFAAGQATDMLAFLAEGLGRRMREWLDYAL
jgi:uncharacterized protein YigA (DUF484 family)